MLGIEKVTIATIASESAFYLDLINSYYNDIIPNSNFLNKANSFSRRADIKYLVVAGTNSNIKENINNKVISQIYPEFKNGDGDGVVSIDSAIIEGVNEVYYANKCFYDIYLDQDVLNKIKDFLDESLITLTIKPFQDDDFIEYQYELEKK